MLTESLQPCPCGDEMKVVSGPAGAYHMVFHRGTPCGRTAPRLWSTAEAAIRDWNAGLCRLHPGLQLNS